MSLKAQRRHITDYIMFMARNLKLRTMVYREVNTDQQEKVLIGQSHTEKLIISTMKFPSLSKVGRYSIVWRSILYSHHQMTRLSNKVSLERWGYLVWEIRPFLEIFEENFHICWSHWLKMVWYHHYWKSSSLANQVA